VELAPAFRPPPLHDSASKLDALQTLRVAVHLQKPAQPANNFGHCSAQVQKQKLRNHSPEFLISKFI
jgi:hypothetical protein